MASDEQNLRVQNLLHFQRRLNNWIENIKHLLGVLFTRYYQILPSGKLPLHWPNQEVPSKSRQSGFFSTGGVSIAADL